MHELILFDQGIPDLAEPPDTASLDPLGWLERNGTSWTPDNVAAATCVRMADPHLPGPLYVCGLCTSSLDMANFFLKTGVLPLWGSVLVSGQSAGRGQLGRSWFSGPGNLFAAVRLPPEGPFAGAAAAPALGAYMVQALRGLGCAVWFKWPNDIVADDKGFRKVCGILLEERQGALVAGIGFNLVSPPPTAVLREGHALPGGCLTVPSDLQGPLALWRRLVSALKFCYEQTPPMSGDDGALASFRQPWQTMAETWLAYQGQWVTVVDGPAGEQVLRGVLSGVAPDGGLVVRTASGFERVYSGSLIPDAGYGASSFSS